MSRERAQAWLCAQLDITFPYTRMGKVDSLDLFGGNELIIFAFYEHNRKRYKQVLDIGANLGLHSMLMSKIGWEVKAYEPDPSIFSIMNCDLKKNGASHIERHQAAVSDRDGEATFIRLLNNMTGSYLYGSKIGYGPMVSMNVPVVDCRPLYDWADFAKIDAEGHEDVLLKCVSDEHLDHLDLLCELRGMETALAVRSHFAALGATIYSQKHDWEPVTKVEHMPLHHTEGSVFISRRGGPWQ
jgi:FkbM family methyltransferase